MAAHAELVSDLKALRKGRGLFVNNVDERVGRSLRDLCGVTEDDGPGEIRYRVAQRITALASDLPEDLRMAVMAAFGMNPDARHPLYQDRVDWIAAKIGRDPRTARRRIDDGIHQLAQLACTPRRLRETPGSGWHISSTLVILMLDRATPQAFERHRIVAARDALSEITLSPTFPEVDPVYGGTYRRGTLVLPAPLSVGGVHEIALLCQASDSLRSLVHVPRRRCDLLELHVRFGARRPHSVIKVQGKPHEDLGPVAVDATGRSQVTFTDLSRGLASGLRWEY
jgi:hypothetical protein